MIFRAVFQGIGEDVYSGNALRFDTVAEAEQYAIDLFGRWFGAEDWAVISSYLEPDSNGRWSQELVNRERMP